MIAARLVCTGALVCLVAACTTTGPATGPGLSRIDNWTLDSKLGVRFDGRGANLALEWQQVGNAFEMRFTGPLGSTIGTVSGTPASAVAEFDGERREGGIEELLAAELGFSVPVARLSYWVRGVKGPGARFRPGNDGFVLDGWEVRYLDWSGDRPRRMTVSRDDLRIRLAAMKWRL